MAKLKISLSWSNDLVLDDEDPDTWPTIRGYLRGRSQNPDSRDNIPTVRIEPHVQPVEDDEDD